MTLMRAIGLMSGTSMDGIDVALIETDGRDHVVRGAFMAIAYEPSFRRRLETALDQAKGIRNRGDRPDELAALERDITLRHADAVARFRERHGLDAADVGVIGFHGQTVLHRPLERLTVQLGDGGLLADKTGIDVVYDMRANDVKHGGQGAPLVPAYHAALARTLQADLRALLPAAFVNIGGIANVTYVPAHGDPVAFDCGPGNGLIDQWVQRHGGVPFDQGGAIASEGRIAGRVLEAYLANPFFAQSGPKSLDRGDFSLDLVEGMELADGARTLVAVTAGGIHRSAALMPHRPGLWIVAGGGRLNRLLIADLQKLAADDGARVVLAEEAGLDGDAMEAEAWAYLAVRSLKKLPLTFPATTGCAMPVTGGVLARARQAAR